MTYHLPPIAYHLSPTTYHLPPTTYELLPMSNNVISVEHLTKQYDLGVIGTGTISRDLWLAHSHISKPNISSREPLQ